MSTFRRNELQLNDVLLLDLFKHAIFLEIEPQISFPPLAESFKVSSIRLNPPCIVTSLLNIKVIRFKELITNESLEY